MSCRTDRKRARVVSRRARVLAAYSDLLDGAIKRSAGSQPSVESASAALLAIFLDGAGRDAGA
ncbi:hypothetical protein [Planctomonas sp. JC2975]|uniref:hypothetical protein n=1 Tax=Planctomonas sp. JC2975 TaxID=2729626 RepID=UPI0014730DEA|nr:hypothetical protein [Planctomonas sp. JC2975]